MTLPTLTRREYNLLMAVAEGDEFITEHSDFSVALREAETKGYLEYEKILIGTTRYQWHITDKGIAAIEEYEAWLSSSAVDVARGIYAAQAYLDKPQPTPKFPWLPFAAAIVGGFLFYLIARGVINATL